MSDFPADCAGPDELQNHLWNRLAAATRDRASGFHLATFCSLGLDGSPSARSIILREIDAHRRRLRFHTDRRSPKIAELSRDHRCTLVFWDSASRTQLRVAGRAQVHVDDELTSRFIRESHPGSLDVYRSVLAPSTPIASPHDAARSHEPLLENVAIVSVEALRLEWLWLDDAGHRRCQFRFEAQGTLFEWLVP